jgi:protein-S-isoprenylcysteine O-methyltransferase Ste14
VPERNPDGEGQVDIRRLKRVVGLRLLFLIVLLGCAFFLTAGTFHYWQAWVYLATIILPMLGFVSYMMKKKPAALERRMRTKEKEQKQKTIIKTSLPVFIAAFLLPGFDRRYGWSAVPPLVVVIADFICLLAYGLFVLVMKENPYASRIVEVENDQRVITTGPYAVVRHPLYLSGLTIYLFSPLGLGSFWALLPALLLVFVFIARILTEEKLLTEKLEGYRDYLQRVRYRLIPGIW